MCVCRRGDAVLLAEAVDPVDGTPYYVAPGGGIEFGERAADAARRELREELGAELLALAPLGVLENIFVHDGRPYHEIVFVFDARLADPGRYAGEVVAGVESDGQPFTARWVPLAVLAGGPPLYPPGLAALLGAGA